MQYGISSHLFLPQRLTPALLDALHASGAQAIEVFAARYHFDYGDRKAVREIADWFRSNGVAASLHMPLTTDENYSRHAMPSLNLISSSKPARIDAQDEVKRALEAAEQVPFCSCVIHLGQKGDPWDSRALDNSLTAIEHLKAFAAPLGVKLLLENLSNEVATPAHLLDILRIGHLDSVGVCFDTGHAHLSEIGVEASFDLLKPKIAELHLSDNHGWRGNQIDEYFWPAIEGDRPSAAGHGTIDWPTLYALAATLPGTVPSVLEVDSLQADSGATATKLASAVFSQQRKLAEAREASL